MVISFKRKRNIDIRGKIVFLTTILLLIILIKSIIFVNQGENVVPVGITEASLNSVKKIGLDWREVLYLGLPGLTGIYEKNPAAITAQLSKWQIVRDMIDMLTSVNISDAKSLVVSEIPVMVPKKASSDAVSATAPPTQPKIEVKNITGIDKPLIGIYHTHTSESFVPSSGVAHKPGGQTGDIVEVGEAMTKRLAQYNIKAVHNNVIHDYPSFMKAYDASETSVKKMLVENNSIQMIFDIHRDADKRENTTVAINGIQAAKITIVVATGQGELVQPHWQENHNFAKQVEAKLSMHFPGLSRGIKLDNWRYNQHLHSHALLLEVGCQENTKEEAMYSMELLADVLAEIISESK